MSEQRSQMAGLVGFILAGLLFVATGVRSGDVLTIVGSVLWIASCVIWMIPLVRSGTP